MPITENELLLIHLIEEQAEVIQQICKALRFGLYEIQEGQGATNKERMNYELTNVEAVVSLLRDRDIVDKDYSLKMLVNKGNKVKEYLEVSKRLGILKEN